MRSRFRSPPPPPGPQGILNTGTGHVDVCYVTNTVLYDYAVPSHTLLEIPELETSAVNSFDC